MNHRIRVPEVRVVDAEGKQLGILPTREALALALAQGLDLVEVAPTAQPPVCRILDYGKFKYQEAKKQREARKNAHTSEIKGIRLRSGTESHDLAYKLKDAIRFLEEGHKVQVTLIFRGREMTHPEIARAQMDRLAEGVREVGVVERPPSMEGRRMTMLLSPK
jgi:translation initiation factor IF-3